MHSVWLGWGQQLLHSGQLILSPTILGLSFLIFKNESGWVIPQLHLENMIFFGLWFLLRIRNDKSVDELPQRPWGHCASAWDARAFHVGTGLFSSFHQPLGYAVESVLVFSGGRKHTATSWQWQGMVGSVESAWLSKRLRKREGFMWMPQYLESVPLEGRSLTSRWSAFSSFLLGRRTRSVAPLQTSGGCWGLTAQAMPMLLPIFSIYRWGVRGWGS